MFACSKLALAEFMVGFSRKSTGAPGARDFVSLTAFFALMTFLIFLAWSARDGLWGRIEQVLLGAMTEGQAPIRLSYHIDNVNKININVLREFAEKFPGLKIIPQRSSDGGSGALVLPGLSVTLDANGKAAEQEGSWGRGHSDKRVTPLRIDALTLDSPLWSWILSKPQARDLSDLDPAKPVLLVAASRYLFTEHFRYDAYRNAIMANRMVPCDLKAQLPEHVGRIDDIRHLVLEVKENISSAQGKRSTVPSYQSFRVVWMDSFPTPEQTAMVVPLSTYEILLAAAERQSVNLYAETLGASSPAERISQIRLAEVDLESDGIAEFGKLASCLGAVPVGAGNESEADSQKQGDVCGSDRAARRVESAARRQDDAGETIGSCERLREHMPVKYPRFIDNGQDLLICAGVHRLLRDPEVATCAKSAGLKDLKRGGKQFDGRLEAAGVAPPPAIEWLGPSRIAMPCGALLASDLEFAKALLDDRVRSAARNSETPDAAASAARQADDDSWIAACEGYKAEHAVDEFEGPKAVYAAQGYQDITVYPRPIEGTLSTLKTLVSALRDFVGRGFHDLTPVKVAASRVVFGDDQTERALNSLAKILLAWETTLGRPEGSAPTPVLRLDPTYESALVRFGVLSLILDKISTPLAAGSLALYLFLTAVILATATSHRRRQYGLLLMSGITPDNVGYIVAFQIVLSCIVGGVAGYVVYLATASAINTLLADSSIVADARLIIGLDVPAFLPSVSGFTVAALWSGMTFLAVGVGTIILRVQRITNAAAPITLVKS
jgi:hypothetical protein